MSLGDTLIKAFHARLAAGDLYHCRATAAHEVFQTSTINAPLESVCDGDGDFAEPVARRLDRPLDDLGRHPLRGLAKPIALFSPSGTGGTTVTG